MPVCAVLGGQWGDEGKGKIVDVLAEKAHVTARFSGGNNAGHTVMNPGGTFKLHLVPSGIFWPDGISVIGNGVVVDPDALLEEIEGLSQRGIELEGRLLVSDRCHLVMPYHVKLDELAEAARGDQAIGTTGKGIGPAYTDKAARIGIRAADLFDLEALYPRLERVMGHHNAIIEKVYEAEPLSLAEVFEGCKAWAREMRPFVGAVEHVVYDAVNAGQTVLLEGAQGAMLDLDPRDVPVRHFVAPDDRGRLDRPGSPPTGLQLDSGSVQGLQHSSRKRTVPDRATGRDGRPNKEPRGRIRNDNGQASPRGLVRLGRRQV